jgi:hypothetical protein
MAHRLITAYRAGRAAYPHTFDNPYAGTNLLAAAHMWRLGRQKAGDESRVIPSAEETLKRMAEQLGWQ